MADAALFREERGPEEDTRGGPELGTRALLWNAGTANEVQDVAEVYINVGFIMACVDTVASVESREHKSHEEGRWTTWHVLVDLCALLKTRGWQGLSTPECLSVLFLFISTWPTRWRLARLFSARGFPGTHSSTTGDDCSGMHMLGWAGHRCSSMLDA